MSSRCKFVNLATGQRCGSFTAKGKDHCSFHALMDETGTLPHMTEDEKKYLLEAQLRGMSNKSKLGVEKSKIILAILDRLDHMPGPPGEKPLEEMSWAEKQQKMLEKDAKT